VAARAAVLSDINRVRLRDSQILRHLPGLRRGSRRTWLGRSEAAGARR